MACEDLDLITADVRNYDGCPALNKIKVAVASRGQLGTLEWTLRDRRGRTLDLSDQTDLTVAVRFREALSSCPEPAEIAGTVEDAPNGVVRAILTAEVTEEPGVLLGQWGIRCDGDLKFTEQFFLLVEDSLFSVTAGESLAGPPTLDELRAATMDYEAQNLLLKDVEFDDADIANAMLRPVRQFNETPPFLRSYTTTDFPAREAWLKATLGHLFSSAADHYRRNSMAYQAGGVTVDDKNKEPQYRQAAQDLLSEWNTWLVRTKASLNAQQWSGGTVSPLYGWS